MYILPTKQDAEPVEQSPASANKLMPIQPNNSKLMLTPPAHVMLTPSSQHMHRIRTMGQTPLPASTEKQRQKQKSNKPPVEPKSPVMLASVKKKVVKKKKGKKKVVKKKKKKEAEKKFDKKECEEFEKKFHKHFISMLKDLNLKRLPATKHCHQQCRSKASVQRGKTLVQIFRHGKVVGQATLAQFGDQLDSVAEQLV